MIIIIIIIIRSLWHYGTTESIAQYHFKSQLWLVYGSQYWEAGVFAKYSDDYYGMTVYYNYYYYY